jgi:hypothetical protein
MAPVKWILGTTGNDTYVGDNTDNTYGMWQGGEDTVSGLGGNDLFNFANRFDAGDTVDGGAGNDTLRIAGASYSDGLTLTATTLTNVENIQLGAGHDYELTSNDATVASGAHLTVNAEALGAGDTVNFNGADETDGTFHFIGGAGFNFFTGGAGNDEFDMQNGGDVSAFGGGGNDMFRMGDTLDASDALHGGAGNDIVDITGDGDGGDTLLLSATSFSSIETLRLENFAVYDIVTNDANVAAGTWLEIDGSRTGNRSLTFDGSAETDGHFHVLAAGGDDTITGGALNDIIDVSRGGDGFDGSDTVTGGGGADHIIAGFSNNSVDTFIYNAASDSTGTAFDIIRNVDFSADVFQVPWGDIGPVTVKGGAEISHASFVADITAAGSTLAIHGAQYISVTSGDMTGDAFLIIDVNGTAGYQSGSDLVIEVTGATGLNT